MRNTFWLSGPNGSSRRRHRSSPTLSSLRSFIGLEPDALGGLNRPSSSPSDRRYRSPRSIWMLCSSWARASDLARPPGKLWSWMERCDEGGGARSRWTRSNDALRSLRSQVPFASKCSRTLACVESGFKLHAGSKLPGVASCTSSSHGDFMPSCRAVCFGCARDTLPSLPILVAVV